MNTTLKKLKDITSENCVTIIMNTHRTKPDSLKDELVLKNLIKEAENRLLADKDNQNTKQLKDQLNKLADQIDHNYNLESLILFVNEDIAEYVRLPIVVTDRVSIGDTFATRDLVRAIHLETNYYVLVLSQEKVRLIEATNDKVVQEIGAPFPIENQQFHTKNRTELSVASRQTNLIAAFFNQVDKQVNAVRKDNPLPVLVCCVEENYPEYLKIADQKNSIFNAFLNKNRINEKDHAIIKEAWEVVQKYTIEKNNNRKAELKKAVSANKFLSDTNEIWRAISEGRIQTLFVEEGLYQPAVIQDDEIVYVAENERSKREVVDDIYDEMIEENSSYGGDVVFLPKGALKKFNGLGAITRY